MNFMYEEKLKIAYDKSNEILNNINFQSDSMIDTTIVIDYIRNHYCPVINVLSSSFEKLKIGTSYGAMMLTELSDKSNYQPSSATIVLNADTDTEFQRFSLLHELGHLVTFNGDEPIDSSNYILSTHINYNVTSIPKEKYDKNKYLLKEQIANIFALRVLMPSNQFYEKMLELKDISAVAKFFGLTKDAVISRMMIGA